MPATAVSPAQLALPLLLPHPPATVDGIQGQLDIVAAVADALVAPTAAVRMAAELSASTGLQLRALPGGAITSAPAESHGPALAHLTVAQLEEKLAATQKRAGRTRDEALRLARFAQLDRIRAELARR